MELDPVEYAILSQSVIAAAREMGHDADFRLLRVHGRHAPALAPEHVANALAHLGDHLGLQQGHHKLRGYFLH